MLVTRHGQTRFILMGVPTSDPISQMVRGMSRQMHGRGLQISHHKLLIVVEELVENGSLDLVLRYSVALTEQLLDGPDALSDSDGWLGPLLLGQLALQIGRRGQVVGMGVRLKDSVDEVAVVMNQGQQLVGSLGRNLSGDRVVVQNRVDDDGDVCGWVCYHILPCAGCGLKDIVHDGVLCVCAQCGV